MRDSIHNKHFSKNPQRLTDKEVIGFFVKYLADQGNHRIKVDAWPDEEKRQSAEIDAIAGPFAIEHTRGNLVTQHLFEDSPNGGEK
jgi:hypothetical protein